VVALIIVVTGISALSAQLQKRHEKQLATTFVQNILSDNSQASYAAFSSTAQDNQSKDAWDTLVQKLSTFFKGSTPQFQKLTDSKTSTAVTYVISGKDGDYLLTVTLSKTKVGWQVLTFNSELKTN